jgi:hypothetical protein
MEPTRVHGSPVVAKVDPLKKNSTQQEPSSRKASKIEPTDKLELSDDAKKRLVEVQIQRENTPKETKPGVYFVTGFDWFGASTIKGDYDGIRDMAKRFTGAKHFTWDQKEELMEEISKVDPSSPLALIGHSFGGDAVIEIANELNTLEHRFRKVDLVVTLDSVGLNNDLVPQNVKKNINFFQNEGLFVKDTPNAALDADETEVLNLLRAEAHAELDDSKDIQRTIFEELQSIG